MKVCKTCGIEKMLSEFYRNSKGQIRPSCKICVRKTSIRHKRENPEQTRRAYSEWRTQKRGHALVNAAKHRAKYKNIPFKISPKDIQRRIDLGICELTGIPFDLKTPRAWNAPSLDQIKPGAGYTQVNTRVVLYALNVMANTWGSERIVEIAHAISAKRRAPSECLQALLESKLKAKVDLNSNPLYRLTWKHWDLSSGHRICALRGSAKHIYASAYTLLGWPTTTRDWKDGQECPNVEINALLGRAVWLSGWVSPTAQDHSRGSKEARPQDKGVPLSQQVVLAQHRQYAIRGKLQKDGSMSIGSCAEILPESQAGGPLNPEHSRWLMGLPIEWASCAPMETLSILKRRRLLSPASRKSAMEYDL